MEEVYNPYTQKVEIKTSDVPDYIQATFISPTEIKSPFIAGNNGFIGGELRVGAEGIVINGETRLIHSSNYAADTTGWIIRDDGSSEFNYVKVRGEITATSGGITGLLNVGLLNPIQIDGNNDWIQSSNFVSGTSGWRIDGDGNAEFQNVTVNIDLNRSGIVDDNGARPDDYADVTGSNTSDDTYNVGGADATDVKDGSLRALSGLNADGTISESITFGSLSISTSGHAKISSGNDYIDIYNSTKPIIAFQDNGVSVGRIEGEESKSVSLGGTSATLNCISVTKDFYVGDDLVVQDGVIIGGVLNVSGQIRGQIGGTGSVYPYLLATGTSATERTVDKYIKIYLDGNYYWLHATVD